MSYYKRLRRMIRQEREGELIVYHCPKCMAMRLHHRRTCAGMEYLTCLYCNTVLEFVL